MSLPTQTAAAKGPLPADKPKKAAPGQVGGWVKWRRRLFRTVLVAFLATLFLPPLQALLLRWVDPPLTLTMVSRSISYTWEHKAFGWPDQRWIGLDELPRHVPAAALATEDRKFFTHNGFDMRSIRRAWHRYQTGNGKKLVGGSTISQQVARNVFLWQQRSWIRKGLEAWYTVWLEAFVPKNRILEVYINVAEMGPMVFGVEAAAQHWYQRPAGKLKPQQAARIMSLLPAPNRWTPTSPPAVKRARWIAANPMRMPR